MCLHLPHANEVLLGPRHPPVFWGLSHFVCDESSACLLFVLDVWAVGSLQTGVVVDWHIQARYETVLESQIVFDGCAGTFTRAPPRTGYKPPVSIAIWRIRKSYIRSTKSPQLSSSCGDRAFTDFWSRLVSLRSDNCCGFGFVYSY